MRAQWGGAVVVGLVSALACSAGDNSPPGPDTVGGGGGSANGGSGGGVNLGGSGAGINVGGGTGGGTLTDGGACEGVSQTADNKVRPVDIIFAIDTSDSMVGELFQVQANMNAFVNAITGAGLDVHIVLIAKPGKPDGGNIFDPDPGICLAQPLATGVCPGGSKPPLYQHVEVGVGSNNALNKIIETYSLYKPTLRQTAVKYFAVVTDDEATDGPNNSAAAFATAVSTLDPGWFDTWKFFGIYCTGSCGVPLACADTGNIYTALVNQSGGVAGDLCGNNQNFQPVFNQMSQAVVSAKTVDCAWAIPAAPSGQTFDKNKVNVNYSPGGAPPAQPIYHVDTPADCGTNGGWYYDDNTNPTQVLVCPSTCTAIQSDPNAKVDVLFGCQTVNVPK